jgi:hypothetical protein
VNDIDPQSFRLSRAYLRQTTVYQPGKLARLTPLQTCLDSGSITPETALMVFSVGDHPIALPTLSLVYHHVVQDLLAGQPWMVSFCSVCNGGGAFSPVVDGRTLTFSERGFYDAMILLYDDQTGSYWDHLRGWCLHGTLRGQQLSRLSNLLHMTARQAVTAHPTIVLGETHLTPEQAAEGQEDDAWRREAQPEWSPRLTETLTFDDLRLPRLSVGLGIWTARGTSRYYPLTDLNAQDNAVLDTFDGRQVLVYVDRESGTPAAFYTTASRAHWERDALVLNTGELVRDGALFDRAGQLVAEAERPLQLFSRWFAFAAKYRGCSIYRAP